jgi:aconitase B
MQRLDQVLLQSQSDANAKYHAEVVIDLDIVRATMIADPDVNNADVSRDTHAYH